MQIMEITECPEIWFAPFGRFFSDIFQVFNQTGWRNLGVFRITPNNPLVLQKVKSKSQIPANVPIIFFFCVGVRSRVKQRLLSRKQKYVHHCIFDPENQMNSDTTLNKQILNVFNSHSRRKKNAFIPIEDKTNR